MAYQSLYRRYRPQRFAEVVGQDHVTRALRNAVREGRVGHAYLFSGPRGTGKTSSARILAKALNCEALDDGEPCGTCASCTAVTAGTSFDVHELDAASNRGIDAVRDLVGRAALGTAGRWKVYILDEAHQLTADATSALLKTLEEPPAHVVFVLATTAPEKVLPTIRSRTQHYEFRLLPPDVLADHLRKVAADAGLHVAPEAIDLVARRGKGSVRDALSALDQVAAAGGVEDDTATADELTEAMCDRDVGRALVAVAEAAGAGRDPRTLANDLLEHLRHAFLATLAPRLLGRADDEVERLADQARRLGLGGITRSMDLVGEAVAQMKDASDLRIPLEIALVRACSPAADPSPGALLERIERLERRLANETTDASVEAARRAVAAPAPPAPGRAPSVGVGDSPVPGPTGVDPLAGPRAALGAVPAPPARPAATPAANPPAPARPPAGPPSLAVGATAAAAADPLPTRDELTLAWGDHVLSALPNRPKSRFRVGRFVAVEDGKAVFALPNAIHRDRCEEARVEVEQALAAHFGRPVPLRLIVDADDGTVPAAPVGGAADPTAAPPPAADGRAAVEDDDGAVDVGELEDAPPPGAHDLAHITEAFPGAELVEE